MKTQMDAVFLLIDLIPKKLDQNDTPYISLVYLEKNSVTYIESHARNV